MLNDRRALWTQPFLNDEKPLHGQATALHRAAQGGHVQAAWHLPKLSYSCSTQTTHKWPLVIHIL